jgi:hypothetical protein
VPRRPSNAAGLAASGTANGSAQDARSAVANGLARGSARAAAQPRSSMTRRTLHRRTAAAARLQGEQGSPRAPERAVTAHTMPNGRIRALLEC